MKLVQPSWHLAVALRLLTLQQKVPVPGGESRLTAVTDPA